MGFLLSAEFAIPVKETTEIINADKRDIKEIERKNHTEMKIYPLSWRSTYSVVGGCTSGSDISLKHLDKDPGP